VAALAGSTAAVLAVYSCSAGLEQAVKVKVAITVSVVAENQNCGFITLPIFNF